MGCNHFEIGTGVSALQYILYSRRSPCQGREVTDNFNFSFGFSDKRVSKTGRGEADKACYPCVSDELFHTARSMAIGTELSDKAPGDADRFRFQHLLFRRGNWSFSGSVPLCVNTLNEVVFD